MMTLKRYIMVLVVMLCCVAASASCPEKFDPARFEADLEQFITTEAALTPGESAAFFPVYREMRKKQMAYLGEARRLHHVDASDDKACAEAIRQSDDNELAIKRLQQTYHEKFMRILSPSKVYRVLRAEDKFHRQMFRKVRNGVKKHSK